MTRPLRILELRSVRGTGGGPEKTILLGAARADTSQFQVTVCYIRDSRDNVFGIDTKASRLPVDYVELIEKHSFDTGIWAQLRALVRERQIDIVHAHEYKTDLLAWLLAKREPVIALSTAHGWTGHSSREHWVYYPLDKRILARYPKVIAVSEEIRLELLRHGADPARVVTVLNGIDYTRFSRDRSREARVRADLGIAAGEFVIGSVGRLEPQKRFDLLIDAIGCVRQQRPEIRLLIVGDGSRREALARQIADQGLGDCCRLLGHRDDITDLHHAFNGYVQSSDYEGTPNSVLEAMALETPVVATDAGGTGEIIRTGIDGVVVPCGDVPALVQAITHMLDAGDTTAAHAASARRRVETDLSFDTRMRTVEAIYVELVAARQARTVAAPLPRRAER